MQKGLFDSIQNGCKYLRLCILYSCFLMLISCSESVTSSSTTTTTSDTTTTTTTTTDSGSTLTDGDFSFSLGSTQPAAGETTTLTIDPTDTATTFKYKLKAIRTAGSGSVNYDGFMTAGSKINFGYPSFTSEDAFTLEFSGSSDTYDIGIEVYDYSLTTTLSSVTFNIVVE